MRPFAPLLVLAAALLAAPLIAAPMSAHAMTVSINHSKRLNVSGSAGSVVVGNPLIADVSVVDSRTVYVLGRGLGSTNLVVLDRAGRPVFSGDIDVVASGTSVVVYRGKEMSNVACDPGCSGQTAQQRFASESAGAITPPAPSAGPALPTGLPAFAAAAAAARP